MKRINKRSNKAVKRDNMNFTAIDMLHDPQTFAEKLFKQLDKITGDFELRLAHIRLIGPGGNTFTTRPQGKNIF